MTAEAMVDQFGLTDYYIPGLVVDRAFIFSIGLLSNHLIPSFR